ncbi:hypothetical protein D3C72_2062350 [compost metagenome]
MTLEVISQAHFVAVVAGNQWQVADDKALSMNSGGFCVGIIGADIADMRISKSNDLAGVGRISEDFLITGHRRIEDHFPHCRTLCPDGPTVELGSVFENQ